MSRHLWAFAIVVFCFTGCGKNAGSSVRGTVNWNGQAVEKGYITFYPAEGADSVRGSEIVHGEYHVLNMTPGRRRAVVTVFPQIQAQMKPEGVLLNVTPTHDRAMPENVGNNQIVEINVGAQVMNFAIGKASK